MKRKWNTPSLLSLEAAIVTKQGYGGADPQGADSFATGADGRDGEPTAYDSDFGNRGPNSADGT